MRSWTCVALLLAACSARPQLMLGTECELSTQCAAPLVCRLGHCREECRLSRDCRAGLVCLREGVCDLPDTDRCALTSECVSPLVCLMGRCSDACMRDDDCPPGALCISDAMGRPIGCQDTSMMECAYNTDCAAPYICAPDGRCREQCHTDRDCRDGLVCDRSTSPAVCGAARDAGPGLDADIDAATPDDTGVDAPANDTSLDAGSDAGNDAAMLDTGVDSAIDAAMAMTGPSPIPLLVGGSDHACATRPSDGQMRCWGNDQNGQIGDATMGINRRVPTLLSPALTNVTMLAAGSLHSCAYSTTSGLRCWGEGSSGQIGDGMVATRTVATPVSGGLVPTWIAAGSTHSCAVVSSTVQCWGDNGSGQLGDGVGTTQHRTPTPTATLAATPVEVEARSNWTCARLIDGRVQCWGDGTGQQLGVDLRPALFSFTPLVVGGVTGAIDLAMGAAHGCTRATNGVVTCWGRDSLGQLGDGPGGTMRATPAPTAAMPPAIELAAAANHTCAITIDHDVYCWGDNFDGACGQDGFARPTIPQPERVVGVANASELTMGENFTCARTPSGIVCWGDNPSGQLGDNSITPHFTPAAVIWP